MITQSEGQNGTPQLFDSLDMLDPIIRVASKEVLRAHKVFCGYYRIHPEGVSDEIKPLAKVICAVECKPFEDALPEEVHT